MGGESADPEISEAVGEELVQETAVPKTGRPELQKDMAPSQLLVPGTRCLDRHAKKVDAMLEKFQSVSEDKLSPKQKQP